MEILQPMSVAVVLARRASWQAVERRAVPPVGSSVLTKEELELVCREMWTALRRLGRLHCYSGREIPGMHHFPALGTGMKPRLVAAPVDPNGCTGRLREFEMEFFQT